MLDEQRIILMFEEMGLGDESSRQYFANMENPPDDRQESTPQIFIRIATTTQPIGEVNRVQLG